MIEWFRLYPLKKLLLAFIWGFCAYQSVRGFRIVWIEKHQEVHGFPFQQVQEVRRRLPYHICS